jgi:hypothetical protein
MDRAKEALYRSIGYFGGVTGEDGLPYSSPWPSQLAGHESSCRFKALFAGARYGKSKWGAMEVLPDIMTSGTRGWIVGPTYEQPSKEFRYIYDALVIKLGVKLKRQLNVSYTSPGQQILITPWGSEVYTKSEENPESLLSEELDWLLLSEGSRMKEKSFDEFLRARLGTRKGRVVVPTTPHGYNWIYKRFYLPAVDGDSDYWSAIVPVIENPLFAKSEYEKAKKELPDDIFEEQYNGKFVAQTGLIYKRFNRSLNVIDPFEIPSHWERYMAIDPHPHTPCGVLWIAFDPHGTGYIYDEMFIPDLTIPELASRIVAKEGKDKIKRRLIDPNAKYIDKLRGQIASVQVQFRSYGLNCLEANNKFESGYYRINEALTPQEVYGQKDVKKPKLVIFKTCKEMIFEFESCNWENEKDNHLLDGLKYIYNDRPMKTFNKEERAEVKKRYDAKLASMNPRTGY